MDLGFKEEAFRYVALLSSFQAVFFQKRSCVTLKKIQGALKKNIFGLTHGQLQMPDIPQNCHSNCPLLTTDQRLASHTFQTHTLWIPLWLHWPLTLGEGGCCLMVRIHSPCVKSFPASVTVRDKRGRNWLTSNWVPEGKGHREKGTIFCNNVRSMCFSFSSLEDTYLYETDSWYTGTAACKWLYYVKC